VAWRFKIYSVIVSSIRSEALAGKCIVVYTTDLLVACNS